MSQILMILFCIIMGEWLIFSVIKATQGRDDDLSHGCFQEICLMESVPDVIVEQISKGAASGQCKDRTQSLDKPQLTKAKRISSWRCTDWSTGDWSAKFFEIEIFDGKVSKMNAFGLPVTGSWTEAEFTRELEEKYRQKKYGSYLRVRSGHLENFRKKLLMKSKLHCQDGKECFKSVQLTWQEGIVLINREEGWLAGAANENKAQDLP